MQTTFPGYDADAIIVGVDEAGRGPLIGPVFAAAVIWDPQYNDHPLTLQIKDSKKLSKKKRDILRDFIEKHARGYCVASVDETTIDKINILNATHMAMRKALIGCHKQVAFSSILVDGDRFYPFSDPSVPDEEEARFIHHKCIIGGDNIYLQIAAASILAKTHHDEYITATLHNHPELAIYGLATNMGYGTATHIAALKAQGPSSYHRRSFLSKILPLLQK
jgi:ribonuclease HII